MAHSTGPATERRSAASAVKKRALEPLDQLPYQRKLTFRQRLHQCPEDLLHSLLSRHAGEVLRIVLGRVVGPDRQRDVVLPVANETILDGSSHVFEPVMPALTQERLRALMDAQVLTGRSASRRWADVSVEELAVEVPPPPQECLTFFCPGGVWHYQVQIGCGAPGAAPGVARRRNELVYRFQKDTSSSGLWWAVALCSEAAECRLSAELRLNPQLLWEQHKRMCNGKAHSFSLLVRDLLRNARSLTLALRDSGGDADASCFYPGLLEPSTAVLQHYAQRAMQKDCQNSESDNLRRYNNLVKTLLIERFVDTMQGPVRVLDLGCGRGQDLQKYSRAFRVVQVTSYVGMDFAPEAVSEARRRYAKLVGSRRGESEYTAAFFVGNLLDPAAFDQLATHGHTQFDVVSIQFTLQYLAESGETVRRFLAKLSSLLRPGGRIIGSIPASDALLDLYMRPGNATAGDGPGPARRRGNGLYKAHFRGEAWARLGRSEAELEEAFSQCWGLPYTFSLVDAVDELEEYVVPWDALEELASKQGLKVVLDAPFPDVLREYSSASRFHREFFSKDSRNKKMSPDEEELFGFYSCFVFERA